MDDYLYTLLSNYYSLLGKTGYVANSRQAKILVILFYYDILFGTNNYSTTKEDCFLMENAMYCFYGTDCLIPYPENTMGTLAKNSLTDILLRLTAVEEAQEEFNTDVIEPIQNTKVIKSKNSIMEISDIDVTDDDVIDDDEDEDEDEDA